MQFNLFSKDKNIEETLNNLIKDLKLVVHDPIRAFSNALKTIKGTLLSFSKFNLSL